MVRFWLESYILENKTTGRYIGGAYLSVYVLKMLNGLQLHQPIFLLPPLCSVQQSHGPVPDLLQALWKHLSYWLALLQAGDQRGLRAIHCWDVSECTVWTSRGETTAETQLVDKQQVDKDYCMHWLARTLVRIRNWQGWCCHHGDSVVFHTSLCKKTTHIGNGIRHFKSDCCPDTHWMALVLLKQECFPKQDVQHVRQDTWLYWKFDRACLFLFFLLRYWSI